jgi:hypothetical protein
MLIPLAARSFVLFVSAKAAIAVAVAGRGGLVAE